LEDRIRQLEEEQGKVEWLHGDAVLRS
jgi:hypothetical protein